MNLTEIIVRESTRPSRHAARLLGLPLEDIYQTSATLDPLSHDLVAAVLAERLDPDIPTGPASPYDDLAQWRQLDVGDTQITVPDNLTGLLRRTPDQERIAVRIRSEGQSGVVSLLGHRRHAHGIRLALEELLDAATGPHNLYRGRMLRAREAERGELRFQASRPPTVSREQVILPEGQWDELGRHVVGALRTVTRIRGLGLGANRGVLLWGPPGTGKTSICKALAAELVGEATVIDVDTRTAVRWLRELYDLLPTLAPALVIIEDVDALAADRRSNGDRLREFLNALDGVSTKDCGVVTLMTTNDKRLLDEAATRAGRIDVALEIPRPTTAARVAILSHYLEHLDHQLDIEELAEALDGATAADLRELARLVAFHDHQLSAEELLKRLERSAPVSIGAYL